MNRLTGEYGIAALAAADLQHLRGGFRDEEAEPVMKDENLAMSAPKALTFEVDFARGRSLELELRGSGKEPSRLWSIMSTIQRLARLRPGWDSYGANPVSRIAVSRVVTKLLPIILREDIPEVTIVPMRDGGLQFEWHRLGIDVEISVPPVGPVEYLVADPALGIDEEARGPIDDALIVPALRRMSQAGR